MILLLAVRFLSEIGMLVCLAVGGWQLGDSLLTSVAFGTVLPLLAAALWGRWVAPRASRRLQDPVRLGLEGALSATALLVVWGAQPSPAMSILGVAVAVAFGVSIPARGHGLTDARPPRDSTAA